MEDTNEKHLRELSKKLYHLYEQDKWDKAEKLLKKEIAIRPDEQWLWVQLSDVYEHFGQFEKSLEAAEKAMEIEPEDVQSIYSYGEALAANENIEGALIQWNKVLDMDLDEIAYGKHGVGLRQAKGIVNDIRFMKAIDLFESDPGNREESIKLINEHLQHRKRGIASKFTKDQVLKRLKITY